MGPEVWKISKFATYVKLVVLFDKFSFYVIPQNAIPYTINFMMLSGLDKYEINSVEQG